MQFMICPDPDTWLHRILAWVDSQPALHSATVNVARKTVSEGGWCGLVENDGRPVLAQTPPHPVMMTTPHPIDDGAVQAVIDGWRQHHLDPIGINGPVDWVRAITTAMGRTVCDEMGLRLHLLSGPPRCPHPAPGMARPWREDEIPLAMKWHDAFSQAVESRQIHPPTPADRIRAMLAQILVWDHDGPRAMARAVRPFQGGWSIAGVYTPPEHRGRGYAGSVVHALCRKLLNEGSAYLALYTDLANPTSNHIYREIGFVPVADQVRVLWYPQESR